MLDALTVPEKKTRGPLPDAARIFDPDAIKRKIDETAKDKQAAHSQPERVSIPEDLPARLVLAEFVPDDDGDGFIVRILLARDWSVTSFLAPYYLWFTSRIDANPRMVTALSLEKQAT